MATFSKPQVIDKPEVGLKEIWMANLPLYCGKILRMKKGNRCPEHFHKQKDETFYIERGWVEIGIGGKKTRLLRGETVRLFPGDKHWFKALKDSVIIEISTQHKETDSYFTNPKIDAAYRKQFAHLDR